MDTGLKDYLRHLYDTGFRRGYAKARIDRVGLRVLIGAFGWCAGVMTGLVVTGWL